MTTLVLMTHLTVQELLHLRWCGRVVSRGVPVEHGAGPAVGGEQVEVDILTGADQAVVIIVSVQHNKTGCPDEIWDTWNMLHFLMHHCDDAHSGETWRSCWRAWTLVAWRASLRSYLKENHYEFDQLSKHFYSHIMVVNPERVCVGYLIDLNTKSLLKSSRHSWLHDKFLPARWIWSRDCLFWTHRSDRFPWSRTSP